MPYLAAVYAPSELPGNQPSDINLENSKIENRLASGVKAGEAVRVTAADGLIIRRGPGGEALGAARCGDVFEAACMTDDWVGVVVYMHANWLQPEAQV